MSDSQFTLECDFKNPWIYQNLFSRGYLCFSIQKANMYENVFTFYVIQLYFKVIANSLTYDILSKNKKITNNIKYKYTKCIYFVICSVYKIILKFLDCIKFFTYYTSE